ncbi:hypothetical protein [Longimicrobium sp.]|jgi:hypothetical protein|uniref:hypothetical protein n=1 Tax=Longimicrobium sp. TaxID=2029185 RepID=UPI002ED8DB9E
MPQSKPTDRFAASWLYFVAASGDEGRRWVQDYSRFQHLVDMNQDCLALLRRRSWDEGAEHLRRFRAGVDAAEDAAPATRALLERWYQAVYGYYWYSLDRHDEARRAMVAAADAIALAIGHLPCLVPLATQCHEFHLHLARIARNERRWADMWRHVDDVRAMFKGSRPFCLLPDGRGVGLDDVRRFYASLGKLPAEQDDVRAYLLDDAVRMRDFDRFVREMLRLPGFVVAYP